MSEVAKYDEVEKELAQFCAENLMEVLGNIDALRPGIRQD